MSMHVVHPSFLDEAKYLLSRRQASEARMRLFDTAAMLLPRDDASNDCVHYYDRNGENSATMKWLALALVGTVPTLPDMRVRICLMALIGLLTNANARLRNEEDARVGATLAGVVWGIVNRPGWPSDASIL